MLREEPNFMKMVQDMWQNLFGRARGRLMGRDHPPDEKKHCSQMDKRNEKDLW